MIDTLEELQIILKDSKSLDPHDKQVIVQAMNELMAMEKQLLATQRALHESQVARTGLIEQIARDKQALFREAVRANTWPPQVYSQGPWIGR